MGSVARAGLTTFPNWDSLVPGHRWDEKYVIAKVVKTAHGDETWDEAIAELKEG